MNEVDQLQAALDKERLPVTPLRPHQVRGYRDEHKRLEEIVHAPAWVEGDRGQAMKRHRSLAQMLADQAPRKTAAPDEVKRLADAVLSSHIQPALLPREIMRRNPAGAVGTFIRQEQGPETKRAIQQWKRARWALDPETDDPDHTNLERFRPELAPPDGASTFMAGAQIPGHFAMTPKAKANWPAEMPQQGTVESALVQVQRREKKKRIRQPMPEAQKEHLRIKAHERIAAMKARQETERRG